MSRNGFDLFETDVTRFKTSDKKCSEACLEQSSQSVRGVSFSKLMMGSAWKTNVAPFGFEKGGLVNLTFMGHDKLRLFLS